MKQEEEEAFESSPKRSAQLVPRRAAGSDATPSDAKRSAVVLRDMVIIFDGAEFSLYVFQIDVFLPRE